VQSPDYGVRFDVSVWIKGQSSVNMVGRAIG